MFIKTLHKIKILTKAWLIDFVVCLVSFSYHLLIFFKRLVPHALLKRVKKIPRFSHFSADKCSILQLLEDTIPLVKGK